MSTTQHPLTEAAAVEMWDASPCPEGYEFRGMLTVEQDATLYAMRAAFDAGRDHERAANPAADADRPWEPLNGRRVYVGDEVRQERAGITITGVVVRVDKDGDPWAADGIFIGEVNEGTWYVPPHPGTAHRPRCRHRRQGGGREHRSYGPRGCLARP